MAQTDSNNEINGGPKSRWTVPLSCFLFQSTNGSTLTINSVSVSHSGNYSCQPSSMRPDSVLVTILAESKSANALQDKASSQAMSTRPLLHPLHRLQLVLIVHLQLSTPFLSRLLLSQECP